MVEAGRRRPQLCPGNGTSLCACSFEGRKGDLTLTLDAGLKNADGNTLGEAFTHTFHREEPKPAVEVSLKGSILPEKDKFYLPFRAVNLSAVEVRVVKVYEKNVLMYLQDNDLGRNGNSPAPQRPPGVQGRRPLDAVQGPPPVERPTAWT